MQCFSLSLVTVFILKSILSDMSIATPALFWFAFHGIPFFYPFTLCAGVPRSEVDLLTLDSMYISVFVCLLFVYILLVCVFLLEHLMCRFKVIIYMDVLPWAPLVAQWVKNLPARQETGV